MNKKAKALLNEAKATVLSLTLRNPQASGDDVLTAALEVHPNDPDWEVAVLFVIKGAA